MNYLIKTGRVFYSLALIVYGLQHFYFGNFRNVFFSPYQEYLPLLYLFAYLFGIYLIISGILVFVEKKGKIIALLMSAVFLILFLCTQLSFQLISQTNKIYHLGLWVNQLKLLALCGGAFVVAASFPDDSTNNRVYSFLSQFEPYGNLLFLFTITAFGIGHFMYAEHLIKTVPAWFHDHLFWVYFGGTALIAAGVAIFLGIRIRVVALLLALMLFLWFWIVHLPGAVNNPGFSRGEYVASAADALAFCGISILIALTMQDQRWIRNIENWTNKHSQLNARNK
jgi:uncharacterized membrane protein YphA (DoxX/SURF4 family)